jgi:hypothetical protein
MLLFWINGPWVYVGGMNNILVLLFLCWYCACIYDNDKQIDIIHCGLMNTVRVLECMWFLSLRWWYE